MRRNLSQSPYRNVIERPLPFEADGPRPALANGFGCLTGRGVCDQQEPVLLPAHGGMTARHRQQYWNLGSWFSASTTGWNALGM